MAVTTQDSNDTAPSCAMLVGNMMMPDPIMLTVTRVVSPMSVIFLPEPAIPAPDVVIHGLLGIGHLCADRRAGRAVQWLFAFNLDGTTIARLQLQGTWALPRAS